MRYKCQSVIKFKTKTLKIDKKKEFHIIIIDKSLQRNITFLYLKYNQLVFHCNLLYLFNFFFIHSI